MPKMSELELKSLLQSEQKSALGGTLTSDLSTERARALDFYNGDMTVEMPSAEGRSSAVSTDVADTVEGLMPSLMEIFASGEETVRFEPVGPEDEAAAEQETDYVNHVFMQKNPGFFVLYTFIKDALLSKNGVVKVFWDETEKEERETYLNQPDDAFMILASNPEVEIIEHSQHEDDEGNVLHDVTLRQRESYGCAKAVNVPPEEFGISKYARTIADANYCFHEPQNVTENDLIHQGYDEDQVKTLPTFTINDKQESDARDTLHEDQTQTEAINKPNRRIRVIEHYVRMDYEGDGEPALYKVTTGGGQMEILRRDGDPDITMVDEMPFATMTPVIVTHRFFGKSIADLVMDIQKIKTALIRNNLDNIYLMNNQSIEVSESHAGERTLDDLLMPNRPGRVIRTKMPGGLNVIPNQPIGQIIYPMLEYMDSLREWRSGVTRQGQGIDSNALQNQSATAVAQVYSAAQAKMKLIARIFAETGVRDMFLLLHGCIRKNGSKAETVRLRGNWVTVDPREWKSRDDMTVNVGLGNGSRQEQVANLINVLNVQKELQLSPDPMIKGIAAPQNIFNTLEKLVERMGLKNPAPYFTDPRNIPPQANQPPPDPNMVKVQGQLQLQGQKQQSDQQIQVMKQAMANDAAQQKTQADAAIKIRQQNVEAELERERIASDARAEVIAAAIDGHVSAMSNASRPVEQGGKTG